MINTLQVLKTNINFPFIYTAPTRGQGHIYVEKSHTEQKGEINSKLGQNIFTQKIMKGIKC